ncbi:MAG: class I SAM-dependent methyltransferase [Candidatus Kaiserbacteria bacterium]|nr:class I SAM-dependent methyltransferase [Candidatus Kaiserbacteria bacterium]
MSERIYDRKRDSIHRGPEGGRYIDQYEAELDRDFKDFEGKRILEIGAGPELRFANNLVQQGIHAEVVSLSPAFANDADRSKALEHGTGLMLAGDAVTLPFPDNSFDDGVALHVTEHLTRGETLQMVHEAARVLRPGGAIDIAPFYDDEQYPNHVIPDIQSTMGTGVEVVWRRPRAPYKTKRLPDNTGYKQDVDVYILTIKKKSR